VDFGEQPVGTVSPFRTVTLTNTGTAPLQITSSSLEPPFAPKIRTDRVPGECDLTGPGDRRTALMPGRSCTLQMAFGPDKAGSFTGAFVLTGSGGNVIGETWRLPLSGRTTVRGAPEVTFSVASVDFGNQRVGDMSIRRVVLTNTGTAVLQLGAVSAERPFDARDGGPSPGCGDKEWSRTSGLPVGRSCTLQVTFRPEGLGPAGGVLVVNGSGGDLVAGTWELPLTGVGVQSIG
jgi:hypothetical protein